jgi:glycosyltransferase involved in cell wall biosynthesis
LAFTRNFGVRNSRGEYLAFLDSDDWWFPRKLAAQVAWMEANPYAGLLVNPSEYWYDWDPRRSPGQENSIPRLAPGDKLYAPPTLLALTHPLGPWGAPCPSSFFMRRSAFAAVGGFEESFNAETFQMYEDIAFLSKVYLTVPVFVADSCLDRYRCHPDSMSQRAVSSGQEDAARRFFFRWLQRHLRERTIKDREIRAAIRRQSWIYWIPLPLFVSRILRRIASRMVRTTVQAPEPKVAK